MIWSTLSRQLWRHCRRPAAADNWRSVPTTIEDSVQVDINHPEPVFATAFLRRHIVGNACIIECDIDARVFSNNVVSQLGDLLWLRQISRKIIALEFFCCLFSQFAIDIDDHNFGAVFAQGAGSLKSYAASSTGHNGDAVI